MELKNPAPRRGLVKVAEEASSYDTTIEKCMYEVLEVAPAEMAEEASTGDMADNQALSVNQLHSMTTVMFSPTDYDGIEKPAPRRGLVEVAKEASTDATMIEKYMYEVLEVAPAEMAEEASTGDMADNQPLSVNQLYTMTTVMFPPTDYDEIKRPAPRRGLVEVAEEASTDDTTIEKCMYDVLDNNETTARKLSTELLEIPQQSVTRGFLELAEEARNIGVEKKRSFLVEEVLPQLTEMTRPMIEPVSWAIDEDLGQLVEVLCECTARVPTVRFDGGQLMQ